MTKAAGIPLWGVPSDHRQHSTKPLRGWGHEGCGATVSLNPWREAGCLQPPPQQGISLLPIKGLV